jgi:hypothetical protein
MVRKAVDCILEEAVPIPVVEVLENPALTEAVVVPNPPLSISKEAIRTSLRASTVDSVFATIFSSATTGILLTNFLLELGATSVEIGFLSSIPMLGKLTSTTRSLSGRSHHQSPLVRFMCFWCVTATVAGSLAFCSANR